jgi:hypothetical protein
MKPPRELELKLLDVGESEPSFIILFMALRILVQSGLSMLWFTFPRTRSCSSEMKC